MSDNTLSICVITAIFLVVVVVLFGNHIHPISVTFAQFSW